MSTDSVSIIGKRLREARLKKRLTQAEVAKMANIGANSYAILERGEAKNITMKKFEKIVKALGVKGKDILPF